MRPWLSCGVDGAELRDPERRLLADLAPGGVVVFARNVAGREQLRELVGELRALPSRPYVAVDLEGGRVNRLKLLIGPLPSPARAAAHGRPAVEALGAALGAACAHFGIGLDFAPVLDLARQGGFLGAEDRCLGCDAREVEELAGLVLTGLRSFGVSGCLKHYPGLGSGASDSHLDLPLLDDEAAVDESVFLRLASPSTAVMVAHAVAPSLGDGVRPASLSPTVVRRLSRRPCGPVIADDLEMGALADFGSLGERAAAAILAGCDQVLVCNALVGRAEVVEHVDRWASRDPRLAAEVGRASERSRGYAAGPLPEVPWDEVEDRCARARTLAGE
ncbi:MAG: glycoside hydrolase family 3 N-terminal domain-containing protein [Acidobacteriota bacterium]